MGVRYGFMRGLVSASLLVVALLYLHRQGYRPTRRSRRPLSSACCSAPCWWANPATSGIGRLERLDLANDYRQLRLDEFTRAHHLLRISHDRLEQRVAGNDLSLRSSLLVLRRQLREVPREQDPCRPWRTHRRPADPVRFAAGSGAVPGRRQRPVDRRALASQGEMPASIPTTCWCA